MAKILMITATSDNNRSLAEKFAYSAREMGHEADVIDLVELDMPMFAIEKDTDYLPEFKTCMKDEMLTMMNKRAEVHPTLSALRQK